MATAVVQGRPTKTVNEEELRYLRETLGYTWNEISSLLGVSSTTLQRRATDWGICKFTADMYARTTCIVGRFI